ncbi:hypothetical protein I203_105764 [Kwoniella mangroviensis CBS 8507]|nr:uncharacterized protein I203_01576 [Kwoniella mangroviensis CBS 8507]OCF69712.1 hypothetical protein I203_01576 [Kwoniella mangroviensis CBS 8507]
MGHHRSRSQSHSTSDRHQNSPINHLTCILLTLISTLFLFLVILYNVPFSSSDTGGLGDRLWLVQLTSRGTEYGFGVWGWCEWSTNKGATGGSCVKKSFWEIPEDAGGDSVSSLNLPSEISQSLSISAFFLVFVLIISTSFLFNLLIALHFHSPSQPSANHKIYWLPPRKMEFRTWVAYNLRNLWLRLLTIIFISAWGLPVLIIGGIGMEKIKGDDDGRVEAKLGSGWTMSLVAIITLVLVQISIPLGGLWNDSRRSGKKH